MTGAAQARRRTRYGYDSSEAAPQIQTLGYIPRALPVTEVVDPSLAR